MDILVAALLLLSTGRGDDGILSIKENRRKRERGREIEVLWKSALGVVRGYGETV